MLFVHGYARQAIPTTCYFPMTEAAFEMLRGGIVPLWNPYLYSGMPFLASMEIGVLYPPNWLHLFVPAERAFCLSYVFHALLAAGGTWLYVRGRGRSQAAAIVSAMAFTFAASTILHHDMGMTSVVYSSAWCPLIFALIDRCLRLRTTGVRVAGGVLACQFPSGISDVHISAGSSFRPIWPCSESTGSGPWKVDGGRRVAFGGALLALGW